MTPAVFFLALALRLLYVFDIRNTPITDVLLIDSATYDRLARLILEGRFRGEEVYVMNPLYPYFLAFIYLLGKGSVFAVYLVQAVLDAASAGLTAWIGARLFGNRVGWLAGAACAIYGPLVFYTGTLLTPTVIVFLTTLCLALLVRDRACRRAERERTDPNPSRSAVPGPPASAAIRGWAGPARLLGAGILVGLAALGRGSNLLTVPLLGWFFRVEYGSWRAALTPWLLLAAGAAIPVGAVTVRNALVEGKFVPISANYAAFYIGHHPGATGLYEMPSFTEGAAFEDEVLGTREALARREGRELTLAESSEILFRDGWRYLIEHPVEEARLVAIKLFYFLNRTEPPTNLNLAFARDYSPVLRALPLGFGVLGPLGLAGMVLSRRRWRDGLLLLIAALVGTITCTAFFVSAEYRMPVVPAFAVFAAFAIDGLVRGSWRWITRRRRETSLAAGWVCLVLVAVVANTQDARLRFQELKRVDYLNFGNLYKDRGDLATAAAMFERSLAIDPRYAPAYAGLSEVALRRGDAASAARYLAESRRYRSPEAGAPTEGNALADGILEAGRLYQAREYEAAWKAFESLLPRAAGNADALRSLRNNIGLCRLQLGELDSAAGIFEVLIAEDSTYVKALNNLGKARTAQGRLEEAAACYRRVLALDPENRIARAELMELESGPRELADPR